MIVIIAVIAASLGFIYFAAHYNFWRSKVSTLHPRILMYHSINNTVGNNHPDLVVSPDNFRWQLNYLRKQGYQFLTMSELISADEGSSPRVALTFDDGFQDNYTDMLPILKEFNAKATIYVCPEISDIDKLTQEQIVEMQASGLIEFGAHTMTHINLSTVSDDKANSEITESKKQVEQVTAVPCHSFSYPYGRLNERSAKLVQQAGFTHAVVVKKGIEAISDKYRIKRISILGKTDKLQFHLAITRGRYRV